MKVIERHEPPNQWPREYVCATCKSKLEVSAADITLPGQRDGAQGWFRCPVCMELIYLDKTSIAEAAKWLSQHPEPTRTAI